MKGMETKKSPLVSIAMLTYNHQQYIRKAIDSVLMQEVRFDYEIVVGEDCSTDCTREIIKTYAHQYSQRFKLILHDKNVGMDENSASVRRECTGKYIAILEGDDFWTDTQKLQKQVDFLEANPDYIGICHKMHFVDENDQPKKGFGYKRFCEDKIYTLDHVEKGLLPGQSATLLYRNVFVACGKEKMELFNACDSVTDAKLAMFVALHGPIYCSDEVMSAYRWITSGENSWSSSAKNENLSMTYYHWVQERIRFAKAYNGVDLQYRGQLLDIGYHAFVCMILKPNKKNWRILCQIFKLSTNKRRQVNYVIRQVITKLVKITRK